MASPFEIRSSRPIPRAGGVLSSDGGGFVEVFVGGGSGAPDLRCPVQETVAAGWSQRCLGAVSCSAEGQLLLSRFRVRPCFLLLLFSLWWLWWSGLLCPGRPPGRCSFSLSQIPPFGTGGFCGNRSPWWRRLGQTWRKLQSCRFPSVRAAARKGGRCAAELPAWMKMASCVDFVVFFLSGRGLFVMFSSTVLLSCVQI